MDDVNRRLAHPAARRATRRGRGNPRVAGALGVLATTTLLASCAASPGPAPIVEDEEEATTSTTQKADEKKSPEDARTRVTVGIDPLRGGVNPHLLADSSATVDDIAGLVLPSAFNDGELNTDLLVSAEEITPAAGAAQTVRYVIAPAAQWSDGTPVSGGDFEYLWHGITATPGVLGRGAYDTVSAVRVTGGGRTVDVDFSRTNAHWRELFSDLLPAHLLRGRPFDKALAEGIPASAGRYLMRDLDQARGTIELQRNDRFWGEDPAAIDLVTFRPVSGTAEASDQLRTGQVAFMDLTPAETTTQALGLVAGTQTEKKATGRRLNLTMNTASPILAEAAVRGELAAQIDTPTVARLTAGRSVDVRVPENPTAPREPERLREAATAERPVRIGADPADRQASAAARVIVDLLRAKGVHAEVTATDMATLTTDRLPRGTVDAVIAWGVESPGTATAAGYYGCGRDPEGPRGSNLSGYCTSYTQEMLDEALAGGVSGDQLRARLRSLEDLEHLSVGLLEETRLQVLGLGITGPAAELADWPAGIPTVPGWRIDETEPTTERLN